MKLITLEDGYNGDTVLCELPALEIDGNLAKLRVHGTSFIKWVRLSALDNTLDTIK